MTVSTGSRRASYTGNSVTATFAAPFQFFDLLVYVGGVLQTVGTHYTITGGNGQTGSVTFLTPPTTGVLVQIVSDTAGTQGVDFVNNDRFDAESTELVLDRLALAVQDLRSRISKVVRTVFSTDADVTPVDPTDINGKLLLGSSSKVVDKYTPTGAGLVRVDTNGVPSIDTTVAVALANKADASAVASALALKADTSTVNAQLANKADTSSVNAALALKADNTAVALKADTSTVNAALATKADTTALTAHTGNTSNPHNVTKAQVGLSNVDNTADSAKPVSSAQAAADAVVLGVANTHNARTDNPHAVTKSQVGLGNVDNTADTAKPVSTAQQTALDLKAPLASPALTGNPTAPTQTAGNNSTRLATTAFVQDALTSVTAGVSSFKGRTGAVVPASGDYAAADITGLAAALALKADLASPALTGSPTAPTQITSDVSDKIATTQFVSDKVAAVSSGVTSFNGRSGAVMPASGDYATADITGLATALAAKADDAATTSALAAKADAAATTSALAAKAPLASPALTGTPTAPTAAPGTNSTQLATTAYADAIAASKAPISSPALTGTPTAPTAGAGTNTTQIATTAYADAAVALEAAARVAGDATKAPLASPALTGTPTAPTASPNTNTTQLATTAYADAAVAVEAAARSSADAGKAPLASPALTGTPTAPTASPGNNSTQLATTAYADAIAALKANLAHTHAVADLSDASANAKTFLQAANYAAMAALLPAAGGDYVKLASGSITTGTTLDINLSSYTAYKCIKIVIHECVMAGTSPTLRMAVSQNGGTSFDTMSSQQVDGATVTASTTNAYAQLLAVVAGEPLASTIMIYDFAASGTKTRFTSHSCGTGTVVGGGKSNTAGTTNLIRFTQSTGSNWTKFAYTVYGMNP